jgi:hypothetical protein
MSASAFACAAGRALVALALAGAALGCAGAPSAAPAPLDPRAFLEAKAAIASMRSARGETRTEVVALELDAPYLPATMQARGAVAIHPPDSFRMIMLGPGGTTALDLWSQGERFVFTIPPIDRTLRGDERTPASERRGLPIDFLRWWMLDPFGGRLLAARRSGDAIELVTEDRGRVTEARIEKSGAVTLHRLWWAGGADGRPTLLDEEWLEASGTGCANVVYEQRSTSLRVEVTCESVRDGVNATALEEPRRRDR